MNTQLPKISEHQIMNDIHDLLRYNGFMVWRNNVGAKPYEDKHGNKRFVRFGKPGFSDLFAIQPKTGRFIAFEVKRPETRKDVTFNQQDFINQVVAQGGIGAIVCSREEAATILGIKGLL